MTGRVDNAARTQTARTFAALACILALHSLRLPFLDDPALWIDEAFSLYHARHSLSFLWGRGWQLESSPPLYYTALWAWIHLFGGAEPVARLLSLLFTALATLCVYMAGASLGGRRAGALAAILFSCQPLMFAYSLEIRPYALQVLLIAAAMAALAKALSELELGQLRSTTSLLSRLAPLVTGAALATYTHSTTPAFLAAMGGAAALYGIVRRRSGAFWVAWFLSGCAALLVITPHLLVMLEVIRTNAGGIAWIPSPDLRWVYGVLRSLAVGENSWNTILTASAGCSAIGLTAWSSWRLRDRPLVLIVGLVLPAIGFAGLWMASLVQPVLMPRTTLWLIVPLCLLVGCGLSTVGQDFRHWIPGGVVVLTIAVMSVVNMNNRTLDRPWPRFFKELAQDAHPADEVVAVDKEVLCVLDYYTATEARRNSKRWRLVRGSGQFYQSYQRIPLGCNQVPQISVEQLSDRLAQGKVMWLLAGDDLQRQDVEAVLKMLRTSVSITRRYEWRNKTLVWRVERSTVAPTDEW